MYSYYHSPYNKLHTRYRGLITHLYMNYHHFHSVMQLQTPSSSSNDYPWEENANAVCAFSGQTKICSDTKSFGLGKSNKTLETMIQKSEKLWIHCLSDWLLVYSNKGHFPDVFALGENLQYCAVAVSYTKLSYKKRPLSLSLSLIGSISKMLKDPYQHWDLPVPASHCTALLLAQLPELAWLDWQTWRCRIRRRRHRILTAS
jgi:hypothetical protein